MDNLDTVFSNSPIFGSWKLADLQPCDLPQKAASAFTAAFETLIGANYEPLLYCGKQVVNGTNYAIICKQSIPAPGTPIERIALVVVHESAGLEKTYSIVNIQTILG